MNADGKPPGGLTNHSSFGLVSRGSYSTHFVPQTATVDERRSVALVSSSQPWRCTGIVTQAFLRKRQHNNVGKTRQRRADKLRDPMQRLGRVLSTRTGHTESSAAHASHTAVAAASSAQHARAASQPPRPPAAYLTTATTTTDARMAELPSMRSSRHQTPPGSGPSSPLRAPASQWRHSARGGGGAGARLPPMGGGGMTAVPLSVHTAQLTPVAPAPR